jgi:hypothetical protein
MHIASIPIPEAIQVAPNEATIIKGRAKGEGPVSSRNSLKEYNEHNNSS